MGETTPVAHGGDPQDRTGSPRPRCIATPYSLLPTPYSLLPKITNSKMKQHTTLDIQKPRTDEGQLWHILFGKCANLVLLVAHDLKLFSLLAEKPLTLEEVCHKIKIDPRPSEALLIVLVSTGLLQVNDGLYSLTALAQDYLLESSPTYYGGFLDLIISYGDLLSFKGLKKAVLTNSSQVYKGEKIFDAHEQQNSLARTFTYGMHGQSIGSALAWPEVIDLSGHKCLLDIGGGSGAHSIGATLKWSNLQAVVLDILPVCEVAQEFITRYGLQSRIKTNSTDMWSESFPAADIHFYGSIYHDWPADKCRFLTQKSFDSLESGGRIIIHEMLYDDLKTGPFPVAAYNITMLISTEGQQYSGHELSVMLTDAGFTDIEVKPTFGYWSIITGRKP